MTKKKKKATHANAKHNQKGQKKMKPQKMQMSVSSMYWEVSLAQIPVPIAQTIIPMRYMDNAVPIVIVYYFLFSECVFSCFNMSIVYHIRMFMSIHHVELFN